MSQGKQRRRAAPATLALSAAVLAALALMLAGCDRSGTAPLPGGRVAFQVVAAENFWGSIAKQLAGTKASVTSIIVNPGTDPHSYEPLLEASPLSGRIVLNAGDLLGLHEGDNPHQWYSPSSVTRVVERITADYDALEPSAAAYFAQRKQAFLTRDLARYDALRMEIRAKYAGTPVGYSESIFRPLGEDLGLKLLTPYSFAKAIAEGTEVSAQDKQTTDTQARKRLIKIWVFNSQNVTPDVQRISDIASEEKIPIATVTETLSPPSDSFEQWQVAELEGIARALHAATGR
jgi:zinc/manganese transport system substrate-binding protein